METQSAKCLPDRQADKAQNYNSKFKTFLILSFGFTLLVLSFTFTAGCGQQSQGTATTTTTAASSTTTSSSTTTTLPGTTVIYGSLYSGTITASSIQSSGMRILTSASSPLPDYQVVAIGTEDNKPYFADKTDDGGNFTIRGLPSGESFYLEIINDRNKFAAPISFGVSSDAVFIAVTPEAGSGDIDLGQIVYDESLGGACPTTEPSSDTRDKNNTAQKSSQGPVPVGAGNLGRGTGEAHYTGDPVDKPDEDNDGLPNAVDIDDDGDGFVDGLDPNPRLPSAVEANIPGINNLNAFYNLGCAYEDYPTYTTGGTFNSSSYDLATGKILAIEAVMAEGTSPSTFSNIKITEGPAWIDTAVASDPDDPNLQTPWKDLNYSLEQESDRWDIHVIPHGTPEAGDVLKYRFTTSSDSHEAIATLSYVFTTPPRLISYTDSAGTKEGAAINLTTYNENLNNFLYSGDNLTVRWIPPEDDLGNPTTSNVIHYLDGIIYFDSDNHTIIEGGSLTISPSIESDPTFGTVYSYPFTPTTEAFASFKFDIKTMVNVSSGGNAYQIIHFKKI